MSVLVELALMVLISYLVTGVVITLGGGFMAVMIVSLLLGALLGAIFS